LSLAVMVMDRPTTPLHEIRPRYRFFDIERPPQFKSCREYPTDAEHFWILITVAGSFERRAAWGLHQDRLPFYSPLRRFNRKGHAESAPLLPNYVLAVGSVASAWHALRDIEGNAIWSVMRIYDPLIVEELVAVEKFLALHPDGELHDGIPAGRVFEVRRGHNLAGKAVTWTGQTTDAGWPVVLVQILGRNVPMAIEMIHLEPI